MQVKLLRAVQVGEIKPVGANVTQKVDVRLICATNQDLHTLMGQGRFREDLFYRINVFPITIPPLRERPDDVPVLVRTFLQKFSEQTGKAVREIDPAAMDLLMRYPWPGNVRELENEIERAHVLTGERSSISVRSLSPRITTSVEKLIRETPSTDPPSLKDAVEELEKRMIQSALRDCQGNRSLVAKRLGLSRQGLLNKINKYRINDS
jgi:Nif-specific regulatory protein